MDGFRCWLGNSFTSSCSDSEGGPASHIFVGGGGRPEDSSIVRPQGLFYSQACCAFLHAQSSHLTPFFCFFVLFHSCFSHARVIGTTLVHESPFHIAILTGTCFFSRNELIFKVKESPDDLYIIIEHIQLVVAHSINVFIALQVLLFGVVSAAVKDSSGSYAMSPDSPVIRAVKLIRNKWPRITVICDVSWERGHGLVTLDYPPSVINPPGITHYFT